MFESLSRLDITTYAPPVFHRSSAVPRIGPARTYLQEEAVLADELCDHALSDAARASLRRQALKARRSACRLILDARA
ncbi:hypothetical protein JK182_08245 [Acetobacter okinawensis]|uniref:hypothetical protein n=1 Tax=Acetobacter okinawensis TaxID=1076594 RepID=UPI001BADEFBA|nr:hypothetical protein [Acetobacter okinawensis]MBS0988654.1 hypothetical protein [Acetobacter okinawensis]